MRIALATCAALAEGWPDDHLLADELRARGAEVGFAVWDDPAAEWDRFELVIVRSTWDYTHRRDKFLAWANSIGERLRNASSLIEWNSDKCYLEDLRSAGIPVVPTAYVGPGDDDPELEGEVVVKPTISAGARDTGRFGPSTHGAARSLLARLRSAGRTAMVQPYMASVDRRGETAIAMFAGRESHVLRKHAVLEPDEEAPLRDDAIGSAEAMYRDDLVEAGNAADPERALAAQVLEHLVERFGGPPLYARIDMLGDSTGEPMLLELEAVEPLLYLQTDPGAAGRLAGAILDGA